jgi:uncharacterized membrane protein
MKPIIQDQKPRLKITLKWNKYMAAWILTILLVLCSAGAAIIYGNPKEHAYIIRLMWTIIFVTWNWISGLTFLRWQEHNQMEEQK